MSTPIKRDSEPMANRFKRSVTKMVVKNSAKKTSTNLTKGTTEKRQSTARNRVLLPDI